MTTDSIMIIASPEDLQLVAALQNGDEAAFMALVERHQSTMVRLAACFVTDRTTAEDVVQETWIAMLRGLDRFEGRASLKTWLFRILTNRAKTRAQQEKRHDLPRWDADDESGLPVIDPDRFNPADSAKSPGHWASGAGPQLWETIPEERMLSLETHEVIQRTMESLPPTQREVMRLHDVDGWSSQEICNILEISEVNQRVLLHRARSKVRQALEASVNHGLDWAG